MGELGISSLLEVYLMTWREFQLRLMAYKRMQREKQLLARQMTYMAGYALHVQKPKPINQFWEIDKEKQKQVSDEQYQRMKAAMEREWKKLRELHPEKYN